MENKRYFEAILDLSKTFSKNFSLAVFFIFVVSFFEIFSLLPIVLLLKVGIGSELSNIESEIFSSFIIQSDIYKLGILATFSLLISGLSSLFSYLIYAKLVWNTNLSLSYHIYKFNLVKSDFFTRSYSEGKAKKDIATEAQQFSVYIVGAFANLIGRGLFIFILILSALYFGYAKIVFVLLGYILFMALIIKIIGSISEKAGARREKYASEIFKSLDEGINNISNIRSLRKEDFVLKRFYKMSLGFTKAATTFTFLPSVPKAIIEISIYFAIIILSITLYGSSFKAAENMILPALFLVRLLPILVLISRNMTEISYAIPSAKAILEYFINGNNEIKEKSELNKINDIQIQNLFFDRSSLSRENILIDQIKIKPGEALVFWGESGSGKTTLAACLSGLSKRDEITFELKVNGKRFDSLHACLPFGFVSQSNSLFTGSLKENITLGEDIDLDDINEFINLLNLHHLKEALDSDIENISTHFSGGEIQRISLLRAIINSKNLIVIDEPTSALDELSENSVYNVLKKLKEKNISILIITHSKTIKDLADHLIEF